MISPTDLSPALYKALEEIELTDQERQLYLLSLTLGPTSVANLAEHLHMPRPNVYKVIAGLGKRGLASFSPRTSTKKFLVESPSTVLALLRKKREQLETQDQALTNDLPHLLELFRQKDTPTHVSVVQGKKQLLDLYIQVFEQATQEVLFFGDMTAFVDFVTPDVGDRRIRRRIERGVRLRALVLPGYEQTGLQTNLGDLREVRVVADSKTPAFSTSFYLFGNKAVIWQPKTAVAVLIEDEGIVAMLHTLFETGWSQGVQM